MRFRSQKEKGQGLVEYAVITALVSIVMVAVLSAMGPTVGNVFSQINNSLADRGFRIYLQGENNTSTPAPTSDSTPTPTSPPTATPTPPPTFTRTPLPSPTPTHDPCPALREQYWVAAEAYWACGGGFWRCRSEFNDMARAYAAMRDAGCE